MPKMSDDERRSFLAEGTRTGKLGTVRADGRAHVAPIWYVLDGDDLVFTTHKDSVKGKTLRHDPRACLCVDDDTPPYAFVMIDGIAKISEDPDELLEWATRIGGRYMGDDRAEEFGRRNGVPGELLVRISPTKIVAQSGVAD